jgi:hypothetical protein
MVPQAITLRLRATVCAREASHVLPYRRGAGNRSARILASSRCCALVSLMPKSLVGTLIGAGAMTPPETDCSSMVVRSLMIVFPI